MRPRIRSWLAVSFAAVVCLLVGAPGASADIAPPWCGCCVLALTGHQTNLPATWSGGDRLAVHATQDLASIGRAASLGCLRAGPSQVRWLIETIPLGAPLFVRA
jgi:hypothetical protein